MSLSIALNVSTGRDVLARPPVLEIDETFATALPYAALKRGSTVSVTGLQTTSLILSLCASATRNGWAAIVGMPALIPAAAEDVDLSRLALVPHPGKDLLEVVSALIDAIDLVVCMPKLKPQDVKRLVARAKQRGNILVLPGTDDADVVFKGEHTIFDGVERGHGRILGATTQVRVMGRRVNKQTVASWTR